MEKILTVSIAAYNAEKYIKKALDSLLIHDAEDVEIIVNNDGGGDRTIAIAKEYQNQHPEIITIVEKENGGYGSVLNKNIEIAKGKYFKQLDGDDFFYSTGFEMLLNILRNNDIDLVYTPFSSIREENEEKELFDIFDGVTEGKYNFDEVINRASKKWLGMHAVTFRTELIRESKLKLPTKTLYTDALYAMIPMMNAESIYIMHSNVYMYRIGRDEQSVSKSSRMRHYREHEMVSLCAADCFGKHSSSMGQEKYNYFLEYVYILQKETVFNYILLNKDGKNVLDEFLNKLKNTNEEVFDYLLSKRKVLKNYLKNRNYWLLRLLSNKRVKKYVRLFSGR